MERETGIEPAAPTLARLCSTTELFPQKYELDNKVKSKAVILSMLHKKIKTKSVFLKNFY